MARVCGTSAGPDQHTVPVADVPGHVVPDVIADPVDIPVRPAQQRLHSIRAYLTGLLSQRPPVLAFQARDQPGHIPPGPGARLRPRKPARDPLMHPVQLTRRQLHHHAQHHAYEP